MTRPKNADNILAQIRSCLDAGVNQPGLVKASVHQTEGYLRGLQGLAWETPAAAAPSSGDSAAVFLHDIRKGAVALRGRLKKETATSLKTFLMGFAETFPVAKTKPFLSALGRLWVRWSEDRNDDAFLTGRRCGDILRQEYEEGVAGELSGYILDDRLHLRNTRDYLLMRGWLQGAIENLRRRGDWRSREQADLLTANFSSIILRALHNADTSYAAQAVERLPSMTDRLDQAIANLAATEPEASHFLRKNRSTILTRALHSGYFEYPAEAAHDLPQTLKELNERIGVLEATSPEAARNLRANVSALIYRALTNGKLSAF